MFKKSLLALSVIAVAASANAASTLKSAGKATGTTVSVQGIAATDTVDINNLVFTVQADTNQTAAWQNNLKQIDITIDGAVISPASNLSATWGSAGSAAVASSGVSYPTSDSVKLVTTGSSGIVSGSTLTVSGLKLVPGSTVSGATITAKLDAISTVGNATMDTASGTLSTMISEFYAKVASKFDAKIDVEADRKKFEGGVLVDQASASITDLAADQHDVTSSGYKSTFVWSGDFAYLDVDGDGKLEAGEGTVAASSASGVVALSANTTEASGSSTSLLASDIAVTSTAKTDVIPAQSFDVSAKLAYTDGANKAAAVDFGTMAAGSWALNGSSSDVAFLPFGTNYAHAVSVTNMSSSDGEISITLTSGGKTYSENVGVAAAKSVTQIGSAVSALAAKNGLTSAALTVVVNAKSVTVKGLYYAKSDGDRVLMN